MSKTKQDPIHSRRRFGPVLEDRFCADVPRRGEHRGATATARPGGQEAPGYG